MKKIWSKVKNAAVVVGDNIFDIAQICVVVGVGALALYQALRPRRVLMEFDLSELSSEERADFMRLMNATDRSTLTTHRQ